MNIYVWGNTVIEIFVGLGLLGLSIWFGVLEIKANRKRRQINTAINFATTDLSRFQTSGIFESAAFGAGSTGMTLLDIYNSCENHEEVLNTLEYRFNNALGPDTTPMEWFSKVEELTAKGDRALGTYISNYVGQAGENAALEMFESQGLKAELFSSRVHADDDLRVYHPDGNHVDYSVKSYSDIDNFKQVITEHPDSSHYVVNSELYEGLNDNGLLDHYSEQGITIVDGHFSHLEHTEMAEEAFSDISEAGDLSDDIPFIALAIFGVKTCKNIHQFYTNKQSGRELGINVAGDLVRVAAAGLFATGGAKIGAIVGTCFSPGIGTIIGSGVGAVIGAIAGCQLIQWMKERFKWGKIIDAIDYFGEQFENGFTDFQKNNIRAKILKWPEIKKAKQRETKLHKKYKQGLNPYNNRPVSLPAVLNKLHLQELEVTEKKINYSVEYSFQQIWSLCKQAAAKMAGGDEEKEDQIAKRLFGEVICANEGLLLHPNLPGDERTLLEGYKEQIAQAPNHPYRFAQNSKEILEGIVIRTMVECPASAKLYHSTNYFVWLLVIGCLIGAIVILYLQLPLMF